ncbi:MAG TPA: hypothetical protein VFW33_07160 [Gemmataceae bacterium]|nr:hypothetical protein [Gemmataceae bacterium]
MPTTRFALLVCALIALAQAGCCHFWHHHHCCYPPAASPGAVVVLPQAPAP